jgi:hypothetical protein
MLLTERTRKLTPPGTSRMRELANDLKRSGIDVINFAAGELDGDASDLIKKSAKLAIDEGCNKYTPTLGMGLKLSLELAGMFIRILLPGERRVALCASIFC